MAAGGLAGSRARAGAGVSGQRLRGAARADCERWSSPPRTANGGEGRSGGFSAPGGRDRVGGSEGGGVLEGLRGATARREDDLCAQRQRLLSSGGDELLRGAGVDVHHHGGSG